MAAGKRSHSPVWDGTKVARDMMRAGHSQASLARKAKVSEACVSRLINGKQVSARLVAKVAKALGQTNGRYLDVAVDPPRQDLQISA